MKKRILVIEDDANIALGLNELLTGEGFAVSVCDQGNAAMARTREIKPDLVLLDIMLPGKSGYEICRLLRAEGCQIPILMLTAKGQEMDKVIGLELGADDYVTKPFGVRELIARINALFRRKGGFEAAIKDECFQVGEAEIDPRKFEITRGAVSEPLTEKELKLIQLFYIHAGQVLSRDKLLSEVWGYNYFGTTRTLDQVIVQLRKKLGDNGDQPKHLLTVHGVGYKLVL